LGHDGAESAVSDPLTVESEELGDSEETENDKKDGVNNS
jgi:hypothetical protein